MGSRYRKTYEEWLEAHLGHFDLVAITVETTVPYASLRATLNRLPILSRDEHFDGLPDVRRIRW
jgi:hypothetical protein